MIYTDAELNTIINYEVQRVINKLIKVAEDYDCTSHQHICRKAGKSEESCRGAQATAQTIIGVLENWELYK